jgi:hypothetical protein
MNNETVYNAMTSIPALVGILYLFSWEYRKYRTDLFREEMFILRDQLFDEAARGLIYFDHPAYGMLRSTMNGFIRFAHRPMALTAMFSAAAIKEYEKVSKTSFEKRLNQELENLPEEARQRLLHYKQRMDRLAAVHLLFGTPESIILHLFLLPISVLVVIIILSPPKLIRQGGILNPHNWIKRIDDTAFVLGK